MRWRSESSRISLFLFLFYFILAFFLGTIRVLDSISKTNMKQPKTLGCNFVKQTTLGCSPTLPFFSAEFLLFFLIKKKRKRKG